MLKVSYWRDFERYLTGDLVAPYGVFDATRRSRYTVRFFPSPSACMGASRNNFFCIFLHNHSTFTWTKKYSRWVTIAQEVIPSTKKNYETKTLSSSIPSSWYYNIEFVFITDISFVNNLANPIIFHTIVNLFSYVTSKIVLLWECFTVKSIAFVHFYNTTHCLFIKLRIWLERLETTCISWSCMKIYVCHVVWSHLFYLHQFQWNVLYTYLTAHRQSPGDLFCYLGHGYSNLYIKVI